MGQVNREKWLTHSKANSINGNMSNENIDYNENVELVYLYSAHTIALPLLS